MGYGMGFGISLVIATGISENIVEALRPTIMGLLQDYGLGFGISLFIATNFCVNIFGKAFIPIILLTALMFNLAQALATRICACTVHANSVRTGALSNALAVCCWFCCCCFACLPCGGLVAAACMSSVERSFRSCTCMLLPLRACTPLNAQFRSCTLWHRPCALERSLRREAKGCRPTAAEANATVGA